MGILAGLQRSPNADRTGRSSGTVMMTAGPAQPRAENAASLENTSRNCGYKSR